MKSTISKLSAQTAFSPSFYHLENLPTRLAEPTTVASILTIALTVSYVLVSGHIYRTRNYYPSPFELLWHTTVYITPRYLLCVLDDLANPSLFPKPDPSIRAGTHALKSQLLRSILGLDNPTTGLAGSISSLGFASLPSALSDLTMARGTDTPPLLRNSRNYCYQNSALQALSTSKHLEAFLESKIKEAGSLSSRNLAKTTEIRNIVRKLSSADQSGKTFNVPRVLAILNRHQLDEQQDTQEWFTIILDDILEELKAVATSKSRQSSLDPDERDPGSPDSGYGSLSSPQFPVQGMSTQRVVCTKCAYSEGLSMVHFTSLTLPITGEGNRGRGPAVLSQLLDGYTSIETISGARCDRCTLEKYRRVYTKMMEKPGTPDNIRDGARLKINILNEALETEEFDDKTMANLWKTLNIKKPEWVSVQKTKQQAIARPPQTLVFHINRSMWNDYGFSHAAFNMDKSTRPVRYPPTFDLGPWILGSANGSGPFIFGDLNNPSEPVTPEDWVEQWNMSPRESLIAGSESAGSERKSQLIGPKYTLSAVISHIGTGRGGHYICYRQHPDAKGVMKWWCTSDEVCHLSSERDALNPRRGNVYMLFYECCDARIRHKDLPDSAYNSDATARSWSSDSAHSTKTTLSAPARLGDGELFREATAKAKQKIGKLRGKSPKQDNGKARDITWLKSLELPSTRKHNHTRSVSADESELSSARKRAWVGASDQTSAKRRCVNDATLFLDFPKDWHAPMALPDLSNLKRKESNAGQAINVPNAKSERRKSDPAKPDKALYLKSRRESY